MNKWISIAMLGFLSLSVVGCATSGMEATGNPDAAENAKHLVIHNERLADKIIVKEMNSRMVGDLLEVNVVLENLTSSDKNVQYRFSWYDSANFEVEQDKDAWTPVVMHGNTTTQMRAVAPNSTVKTYKVNVREQE